MKYGFLHTAAVSPALHVADCAYNTQQIIAAMRAQAVAGTKLLCLPEFTLTGYTCSDLFLQETLCRGAEDGLIQILDASKELDVVALVGLPVRHNGKLYNCAAVVCKGQLLGLVPKTYLPNYGEFYERRHFVPGPKDAFEITFAGQRTLFGTNLLFACREMPEFVLGVEICEDLWAPVPPSCSHALAGATVVANLSASDETVGKAAYRRELLAGQSARLLCGYVYADAGHGESTTDMTFAAPQSDCGKRYTAVRGQSFFRQRYRCRASWTLAAWCRSVSATRPLCRMPPDTRPSALIWKWQKHR